MRTAVPPRSYLEWRVDEFDRREDAAYTFGHYLIKHCRDEALASLPDDTIPDVEALVEKAVDVALHNVCDLLEGFWPLNAGPDHTISLALAVQVRDSKGEVVESVGISPAELDLPIGYWKWAHERIFR